jgi:cell division protease FtsH
MTHRAVRERTDDEDRDSERTAETIDAEIQQMLNAAHERVRTTLGAKRATLEAVAKHLIQQDVVDRAVLVQLIAETEPATSG